MAAASSRTVVRAAAAASAPVELMVEPPGGASAHSTSAEVFSTTKEAAAAVVATAAVVAAMLVVAAAAVISAAGAAEAEGALASVRAGLFPAGLPLSDSGGTCWVGLVLCLLEAANEEEAEGPAPLEAANEVVRGLAWTRLWGVLPGGLVPSWATLVGVALAEEALAGAEPIPE